MLLYKKGFEFTYAGLTYQKQDDEEFGLWACMNSNYVVNGELRPESEKYFWVKDKEGNDTNKLNRFGFKWTDEQVKQYYNL